MLILTSDHHFQIGHMHLVSGKPCQDYATSGVHDDVAFAVVSDGCSTGGKTDVGARVLALSTATAIAEHWGIEQSLTNTSAIHEVRQWQRAVASASRTLLRLSPEDMLATCLYAYIGPNNGYAHIEGDGVVALKYRDAPIIKVSRYEWYDNMPFYPAYTDERLALFREAHGNDLNAIRFSEENYIVGEENVLEQRSTRLLTLREGLRGVTIWFSPTQLQNLEYIALFSDGVTQIDGVDWKKAVMSLMSFKNTTGAFAKRRMIRVTKDMKKSGKGPLDDIAYAVIRIDNTEVKDMKENGNGDNQKSDRGDT